MFFNSNLWILQVSVSVRKEYSHPLIGCALAVYYSKREMGVNIQMFSSNDFM